METFFLSFIYLFIFCCQTRGFFSHILVTSPANTANLSNLPCSHEVQVISVNPLLSESWGLFLDPSPHNVARKALGWESGNLTWSLVCHSTGCVTMCFLKQISLGVRPCPRQIQTVSKVMILGGSELPILRGMERAHVRKTFKMIATPGGNWPEYSPKALLAQRLCDSLIDQGG